MGSAVIRGKYRIQEIFRDSFEDFRASHFLTPEQILAAECIIQCRTGELGYNYYECTECGYVQKVARSCGNRNCPNCQAVDKEVWLETRKGELIDAPYFHIVGTLPHELNPLLAANKKALYELLHRSMGRALTELSLDSQYLGAVPGIIQVLHTWDQKLQYHVHTHAVVSGGGLTKEKKLVVLPKDSSFFIPVRVLSRLYRGKYLDGLKTLYKDGKLSFPGNIHKLTNYYEWKEFVDGLYKSDWNVFIKETFNGNGNAIEYLARYSNRIAISNSRILSYDAESVTIAFTDRKDGNKKKEFTIGTEEFIHRFLQHVLPKGFQKIRYYGYLNNSTRRKNLEIIFQQQGGQKYIPAFDSKSSLDEIIKLAWDIDIRICPHCKKTTMMFQCSSKEIDELSNGYKQYHRRHMTYPARAKPA